MTPHDEPRRPLGVAVSLEKRGPGRRRGRPATRLVPPPEQEPRDPSPVVPTPPDPAPHDLDPSTPGPFTPGHIDPGPFDPVSHDPAPAQPDPGLLDPPASDPSASDPRTSDPPPLDPDGSEPPTPSSHFGLVPAEVSLRIPLWWSDGRRADVPLPPKAPGQAQAEDDERAFSEPERPFAWAFDGAEEPPAHSSGGLRILWILGGAAALAAVVAAALVLGGERGKTAERPDGPPPSAPQAPAAAPPGPASAYVPRALTLGGFENKVQVTWQPPERIGEVAGFMVVAQSRDGAVLEHRLAPVGETSAVFATPPMTRDGCIVVAALVRGPTGVTPMRADPVCLTP